MANRIARLNDAIRVIQTELNVGNDDPDDLDDLDEVICRCAACHKEYVLHVLSVLKAKRDEFVVEIYDGVTGENSITR
jgi:hypothetical protein